MASIDFGSKEIACKLVYYGPGLGGKTTNLQYVHDHAPAQSTGAMVSLATESDRTLFFDFLPLEAARIGEFKTKFQLYTVPGQTYYNATRKLVLQGADGVVFVADSQWSKMRENVESFRNLQENLAGYGRSLEEVPYLLQYNKRDLPAIAPVEYMEFLLNNRQPRVFSFEAIAITGYGVFKTLNAISKLVLASLVKRGGR